MSRAYVADSAKTAIDHFLDVSRAMWYITKELFGKPLAPPNPRIRGVPVSSLHDIELRLRLLREQSHRAGGTPARQPHRGVNLVRSITSLSLLPRCVPPDPKGVPAAGTVSIRGPVGFCHSSSFDSSRRYLSLTGTVGTPSTGV